MKNELEPWDDDSDEDFEPSDFHYKASRPYRLWFEFLKISPSYKLAQEIYSARLKLPKRYTYPECSPPEFAPDTIEIQELLKTAPPYIEEVIRTYYDFGCVTGFPFKKWWIYNCVELFGQHYPSNKPEATELFRIPYGTETITEDYMETLNGIWQKQRKPGLLLVAIPLTGTKADLIKSVEKMINPDELKPVYDPRRPTLRYPILGKRQRLDSLASKLRLLWLKANKPNLELWRLGVDAKVGDAHKILDSSVTELNEYMREQTPIVASATSHALSDAIKIMENAARGLFPCTEEVDYLKIDYSAMNKVIQDRLIKGRRNR